MVQILDFNDPGQPRGKSFVGTNTPLPVRPDLGLTVAAGRVQGLSSNEKFGRNDNVGTTFTYITEGGIWRTPQVGNQTRLRVKAGGNAGDAADGPGARSIALEGIDALGNEIIETIPTNGILASVATTQEFLRLNRIFIASSGSYYDENTPSAINSIAIENEAGTQDWGNLDGLGTIEGQSEIACTTIPLGFNGYLTGLDIITQANKTAQVAIFQRRGILQTAPPYEARRVIRRYDGVSGDLNRTFQKPIFLPELTDVMCLGRFAQGAGSISFNFAILLEDKSLLITEE